MLPWQPTLRSIFCNSRPWMTLTDKLLRQKSTWCRFTRSHKPAGHLTSLGVICTTMRSPMFWWFTTYQQCNETAHKKGILCHPPDDQCLGKERRWYPWSISLQIWGHEWPTCPTRRKEFNTGGVYYQVQLFEMYYWALPLSKQENLANAKVSMRQILAEERPAISTWSIQRWKVLSVHNNSVADNVGLSSFV